jgi:hypothetical protein
MLLERQKIRILFFQAWIKKFLQYIQVHYMSFSALSKKNPCVLWYSTE